MKKIFFLLFLVLQILAKQGNCADLNSELQTLGEESSKFAKTPFETGSNLLTTISAAGLIGLTYIYDQDVKDKLQSKDKGVSDFADIASLIGDPYLHLGLAAIVYTGGVAADSPKWTEAGEMMAEALIIADASTFIVKEATGRGRPIATKSKDDFKPFQFKSDFDSFPSMHTASSFALASVLAATTESLFLKSVYYLAATSVGFSRIYKDKHWTSDVLLGAALGELSGAVVTDYHATKNQKKFAVVPHLMASGMGLSLVKKW